MLEASKAGPKCKQLALSELPKYVGRYPALADKALDILADLFEEKDEYRLKAIQGFKVIAGSAPGTVIKKLVGLLGQILQSEAEAEVNAVNEALVAALQKDVMCTVTGLLEQLGAEAATRARAAEFIERALLPRAAALLNTSEEVQATIADALKKVMGTSVSPKEFTIFMRVLFSMNKFKNGVEGASEILDFVHTSIELDKDFDASADHVDRLIMCTASARLIYQHGAPPNKLVSYLSSKVLPKFGDLSAEHQLKLLKLLADIAPFIKGAPCRVCLPQIWPLTLALVPDAVGESTSINWAALECLLYTFHHLASRVPGFLHGLTGLKIFNGQPENKMDEDHSDKLAQLTAKMTTLVTQSGEYSKKMQQVLQKLRQNKPDTPEAKKENSQKMQSCDLTMAACRNVALMAAKVKGVNLKIPDFLADDTAVRLSFKGQGGAGGKRGHDGSGGQGGRGGIRGGRGGGGRGGGGGPPPAKKQAKAPAARGRGGMVMRGAPRGGRGGMRGRGGRR